MRRPSAASLVVGSLAALTLGGGHRPVLQPARTVGRRRV